MFESLKKVGYGETKAWNYELHSVSKAIGTIPHMQYLGYQPQSKKSMKQ